MITGKDVGEYAIIINGEEVDTAYGDQWAALAQEEEWIDTLQDEQVADNLETPFEELYQDDSYWKNGHVAPLRLDDDSPIPFQGEPIYSDDGHGNPYGYDLEARG